MNLVEVLLIVIGLSINVFLVSEYEGTMLPAIKPKVIAAVCGIFFLLQIAAMYGGYQLAMVPFLRKSGSIDLKRMCYFLAVVIFFGLAAYMITKAVRREVIIEKAAEIRYKNILAKAAIIAVYTFLAGICWGFLGHEIGLACITVACATILAVLAGTYLGYRQGAVIRPGLYLAGGLLFAAVGIDVIVRYLRP